jgi:hypothetical protein
MPMMPRWVPRPSSQVYESGPGSFVPISVQVSSSGNGFKGVYSTYHRVDFNQSQSSTECLILSGHLHEHREYQTDR